MNKQNKKNQNRKGFTLIELIVVIAILAILAAVAIPNFMGLTRKAEIATEVAAATEYVNAINVHNALAEGGTGTLISAVPATLDALNTALGGTAADSLVPKLDRTFADAKILKRITITNNMAKITNKGELPSN